MQQIESLIVHVTGNNIYKTQIAFSQKHEFTDVSHF